MLSFLLGTGMACHAPMAMGAHSGLPSILFIFIWISALTMTFFSTYLVRTSAMFSVPSTLPIVRALVLTLSYVQRSNTSRCRIFPRPFLLAIPIAAVASENISMGNSHPKSRRRLYMPRACEVPWQMPCSLASPLDSEIVDWVLAGCARHDCAARC